ncbi:MAG: alpha/beta hydrolase [Pseudomonadales bacterium]|nr:alpha/beta hydrolase [Pseudomonadales bacterium]
MPNLKRFKGAALVLNAEHDNFADESSHRVLEAHLPQAKHQLIERCGHMAFIDRYELLVDVLKQFFADLAEKRVATN